LGVVLQYSGSLTEPLARSIPISPSRSSAAKTSPVVAVIGAGNYSRRVLIPAFRATSARLTTLVSEGGTSSVHVGRKHGFESAATDPEVVLGDASVNAVAIATRHDSHSDLVCRALRRGKNVFVEKPLTVTREQLDDVIAAYKQSRAGEYGPIVMIGFNRRFAPQILKLRELLSAAGGPKSFVMTINSGEIPVNHWVQDPDQGGRIIGEACHFIDLLRFLADSPIVGVHAVMMGRAPSLAIREDKASITLEFEDGSFGTVHYLANGHRSFPKERLEVFCQGAIIALDNFRRMNGYGWPGFRKMNLRRQDKGNVATVATFVNAINDGLSSPIPFDEIVEVSRATFDAVDHMHGL